MGAMWSRSAIYSNLQVAGWHTFEYTQSSQVVGWLKIFFSVSVFYVQHNYSRAFDYRKFSSASQTALVNKHENVWIIWATNFMKILIPVQSNDNWFIEGKLLVLASFVPVLRRRPIDMLHRHRQDWFRVGRINVFVGLSLLNYYDICNNSWDAIDRLINNRIA
jgi:hypothetical protein